MHRYTVVLIPDLEDGGFTVQVPALPGCFTEGDTLDEALTNAHDVIRLFIEELTARGAVIPEEQVSPQVVSVLVDADTVPLPGNVG